MSNTIAINSIPSSSPSPPSCDSSPPQHSASSYCCRWPSSLHSYRLTWFFGGSGGGILGGRYIFWCDLFLLLLFDDHLLHGFWPRGRGAFADCDRGSADDRPIIVLGGIVESAGLDLDILLVDPCIKRRLLSSSSAKISRTLYPVLADTSQQSISNLSLYYLMGLSAGTRR